MSYKPWSFRSFPPDFQTQLLKKVAKIINNNESVQLVGAPGSGSTLLVKAISQVPQIKNKYFDKKLSIIVIDGYTYLERDSISLQRYFLKLLCPEMSLPEEVADVNEKLENELLNITQKNKLLIVIDHIEELDTPQASMFFRKLVDLSRRFEPNIQFLFTSTRIISSFSQINNYADLGKIMVENVLYIPTLDKKTSFWLINESEASNNVHFSLKEKEDLFYLSSGFPRTIKRLVEAVKRGNSLKELAINPLKDTALALHLEELIKFSDLLPEIPILNTYDGLIKLRNGEKVKGFVLAQKLTKIEAKILKIFIDNIGELVQREESIETVWGGNAKGISDHAYDQLVHRLRSKLVDTTPSVEIETVRGRGHILRYQ